MCTFGHSDRVSVHVQVNKQVGPKVQEFVCLLVRAVNA